MVPLWQTILLIVGAYIMGGSTMYAFMRTSRFKKVVQTVEEPKPEPRPLNVFDAYSDEELAKLRTKTAKNVREYRDGGYQNLTLQEVKKLRQFDDEIEARNIKKIALEETRRGQHERDMAIFDTVYGEILKGVEHKKEIK